MNTQTGDTFVYFDEKTRKANHGQPLTLQEQQELGALPNTQARLRRYKQMHADDRCEKCALILRQHTLKEWQYCQWVLSGGSLESESDKG
jgi:hypothetical protein